MEINIDVDISEAVGGAVGDITTRVVLGYMVDLAAALGRAIEEMDQEGKSVADVRVMVSHQQERYEEMLRQEGGRLGTGAPFGIVKR